MEFINVADLDSGNGKTYRQINNETNHTYSVGDLVELWNGARMFVVSLTRDCDGTPLYSLAYKADAERINWCYGFSDDSINFKA